MKFREIRKKFFDFFVKHGHTKVPSSSLIPAQDPTLLFANAGMNQFKDVFLGLEKRSYNRAVSIQKCVRAGGKHNDLDNVGFTKRHLTFFEMMGNFSFGDYFKKEAIQFAWDFLTKEMKLPKEKLHATVFETDDESYNIWKDVIGLPEERIHRLGASENFWQMGDTGPCGPCTEILFDRGPGYGSGTTHGDVATEGDRYLEIWNLVFMQYDRQPDGTDKPLQAKGVDTGIGLERLALIVENKDSVFDTDLFSGIIKKIEKLTDLKYNEQDDKTKAAFNVLADHVRSASLLIADGAAPSNEGRGYVLRKIIRRAALFAQKLEAPDIFPKLTKAFIDEMSDIYPELKTNEKIIITILESEIAKFAQNLVRGQAMLHDYFKKNQETKVVSGEQAFKLYDTFGFPIEIIHLMAGEHGFTVNTSGFDEHMKKQKEQSGAKKIDELAHINLDEDISTEFTGYQELETESRISALIKDNKVVDEVNAGETCWVVVQKSPFFIVGGGQVPDNGWITIGEKRTPIIAVRFINKAIAAQIKAPVDMHIGDTVTSTVHEQMRTDAMKNHTATHLLQSTLIQLFGKQIKQSGSLVHPDYLRFDFTYHRNLTSDEIKQVEDLVNEKIRENIPLCVEQTTLKDALNRGALAFFGDKYNPEEVRLVQIDDFSAELCGGTHVPATGVIGTFKIIEVTALSAGHRRIVAVTGPKAIRLFQDVFDTSRKLSQEFKVKRGEVVSAVEKQKEQLKNAQLHIKKLKNQVTAAQIPIWEKQIVEIGKVPFLFLSLQETNHNELKEIATKLASKKPGFYFFASTMNNRPIFYALASEKLERPLDMKKFATWLKDEFELRSGGKNNQVQGGGAQLPTTLEHDLQKWIKENQ